MTGREFIKRVTETGRKRGVAVRLDSQHGKGSHAMLYYGARKTIVPDRRRDIHPGLLAEMLRQLNLSRSDIQEDPCDSSTPPGSTAIRMRSLSRSATCQSA